METVECVFRLPQCMFGPHFCQFITGSPWIGEAIFTFPGNEEENCFFFFSIRVFNGIPPCLPLTLLIHF